MLQSRDPSFSDPVGGTDLPGRDRVLAFFAAIAIVTVLYVGREVFVPIAVAILLSFVMAPVIRVLRGIKVPRSAAVTSVVVVTFVGLIALGGVLALQVTDLVAELPKYRINLSEKIRSIKDATGGSGTFERTMDMLQDLARELEAPRPGQGEEGLLAATDGRPIPVEIKQPPPGTLGTLSTVMAPLLHPLATLGIIFIFVLFILFQREDLRNRVVRLAGAHDMQRTTAALDDAASRLSRFFLAQVALNASFGAVIGVGLWLIGVPSALLWGIAAAVLRFVPYIGAAVAAALPIGFALAVDPGWTMVLSAAALFIVVEPLVGHVIEPLLYGRSTGLSPVAVIAAATFWTWLWGPIGLLLSTPLTLCLVVLGRHVESLEFIDVALGDRPPLSDSELLYQRLLAADPVEAAAAAEEVLRQKDLDAYCDGVVLPALKLAQRDAARGALDAGRQERIRDTLADLLDHLPEPEERLTQEADAEEDSGPRPEGPRVLVLPARSALDEAAGLLLVYRLMADGIQAEAAPPGGARRLASGQAEAIILAYLSPATPAHRRYTIRSLNRDHSARRRVMVADFMSEGPPPVLQGEAAAVSTVKGAVEAAQVEATPEAAAPTAVPARAGAA
ncbi:AI-2E family transporter [Xanthobacter flavus]|uniref:AI-2E family transporter n=1 Tax=Xanthobacter flavus TaxID=281 RepID=UPI001AE988DE|nr:AI-2E family transporter [Xanthobacter flavus]MBP2150655.1 putative PurR-regulated permease PerM [Xanthobacter flavus]